MKFSNSDISEHDFGLNTRNLDTQVPNPNCQIPNSLIPIDNLKSLSSSAAAQPMPPTLQPSNNHHPPSPVGVISSRLLTWLGARLCSVVPFPATVSCSTSTVVSPLAITATISNSPSPLSQPPSLYHQPITDRQPLSLRHSPDY
ncbi:hypothetical protein AB3S75_016778 [Citrus x aurantiifolia]